MYSVCLHCGPHTAVHVHYVYMYTNNHIEHYLERKEKEKERKLQQPQRLRKIQSVQPICTYVRVHVVVHGGKTWDMTRMKGVYPYHSLALAFPGEVYV